MEVFFFRCRRMCREWNFPDSLARAYERLDLLQQAAFFLRDVWLPCFARAKKNCYEKCLLTLNTIPNKIMNQLTPLAFSIQINFFSVPPSKWPRAHAQSWLLINKRSILEINYSLLVCAREREKNNWIIKSNQWWNKLKSLRKFARRKIKIKLSGKASALFHANWALAFVKIHVLHDDVTSPVEKESTEINKQTNSESSSCFITVMEKRSFFSHSTTNKKSKISHNIYIKITFLNFCANRKTLPCFLSIMRTRHRILKSEKLFRLYDYSYFGWT